MKLYHVKEEYQPNWGSLVDDSTVITAEEVEQLSRTWNTPISTLVNQLYEDDEIVPFIASAFLGESDRQEMSEADAAYTMKVWDEEEIEYPAGLTAEIFSKVWNSMINSEPDDTWYAVLKDDDDHDYGYGSADKLEAITMAAYLRDECGNPDAYIAITSKGSDFCSGEIRDF